MGRHFGRRSASVGCWTARCAQSRRRAGAGGLADAGAVAGAGGVPGASVEPPVGGQAAAEGIVDEQEGALLEVLDAGLLLTDADGVVDDEEGALLEELDAGLLPTDAEEFGEGDEPRTRITPDDPDPS